MKTRNMIFPDFLGNAMKLMTAVVLMLAVVSCESDDDTQPRDPGKYADGVFVLNEGSMGSANASVSFIPAAGDTVQGDIYQNVNDTEVLGDVLMDMVSVDTLSFLVLNKSKSLVVVNNKNFNHVAEITDGISSPRHAVVHDGLIYVTQWGNQGNEGKVAIVNPENYEVIDSIAAGIGPEGIRVINDEIWVANGGIGQDNTISVIDPAEKAVSNTIEGGDCPKDLAVDAEGNVWAVCSGYTDWETGDSTKPFLQKMSASDYEVVESFELPAAHSKIAASIDGETLYFGGGYGNEGIFAMDYNASELPTESFINETLNGIGIHPENGDIYCGIAPSFTDPGHVEVYSANGNHITTYEENIGIGPNNFVFMNK